MQTWSSAQNCSSRTTRANVCSCVLVRIAKLNARTKVPRCVEPSPTDQALRNPQRASNCLCGAQTSCNLPKSQQTRLHANGKTNTTKTAVNEKVSTNPTPYQMKLLRDWPCRQYDRLHLDFMTIATGATDKHFHHTFGLSDNADDRRNLNRTVCNTKQSSWH